MEKTFPAVPVYSCEEQSFEVYDGEEVRSRIARHSHAEPWLNFQVGPENIFESTPKQVLEESPMKVVVECEDGAIITLDFDAGTAHKDTLLGKFVYYGLLEEGSDGQGYIRV